MSGKFIAGLVEHRGTWCAWVGDSAGIVAEAQASEPEFAVRALDEQMKERTGSGIQVEHRPGVLRAMQSRYRQIQSSTAIL